MVLNLYNFRHAEVPSNLDRIKYIGGQSNHLQLSPRGIKQSEALACRLKEEGIIFDEIYSSTAIRAIHTTKINCNILGFPLDKIVYVPQLLELSQGDWEGKERSQIITPQVLEDMTKLHWEFKAPNGESQRDLEERAYGWVDETFLVKKKDNITVGLFTHGVTIKCFLRGALKFDPRLTYRLEIDNCSITHLKYAFEGQHKGWSLVKINDNAHLNKIGFAPTGYV